MTPPASARAAGLRYVRDDVPGITRHRRGKGFVYKAPGGRLIRGGRELKRIKAIVIPPAWSDVWICTTDRGHIQATGRDARGRKQYRYHPRWRELRDETKYERLLAFGAALPALRRRIARDMARSGLPREKVLAAVVQLLEKTLIRVGNEEYARANKSFGLTTMRDRHVEVSGSTLTFQFRGKGGRAHTIEFSDPRLATIVRRCQELPGQELFQYRDENGTVQDLDSGDVNAYLREAMGDDFTAKDFRTWVGTVLAALALAEMRGFTSERQAKRNVKRAIEAVAGMLGNTTTVCRKCYVHPAVIDSYLDRTLLKLLSEKAARRLAESAHLSRAETAVLALLGRRLKRESLKKTA